MKLLDPEPLCVIPTYITQESDVGVLETTVRTLRGTCFDSVNVILVDDCSPMDGVADHLQALAEKWKCELHIKDENTGFSQTVNIGLQKSLDEGRHAILVNADLQFRAPGWVERMAFQENLNPDNPGYAYVVGALLSFPNHLVQHGGVYFSLLTRSFDHLWKYSPENLAELLVYRNCPVTGALQFIRHECLVEVGIYDPEFSMAFEDVDYCLRVFTAGHECVFSPAVQAFHHESLFRGRQSEKLNTWHRESLFRLLNKWKEQSFAGLVPQF